MTKAFSHCRPQMTEALNLLGIRHFLLGIHDTAFPGLPGEDIGCGSPYSDGAAQFLRFVRDLGFNGIQFGPQGITSPGNPSPYDGTFFSRNPLALAPLPLTRSRWKLLDPGWLAELIAPDRLERSQVNRAFALRASQRISAEACARFRQALVHGEQPGGTSMQDRWARFRRRHAEWLARDALYEVLRENYGGNVWRHWGESEAARLDQQLYAPQPGCEGSARRRIQSLQARHRHAIDDFCFTQFLLAEQHRALRRRCRNLELKLFGDCQIGFSDRDAWFAQSFLLPGYVLGAPPSRTNPAGQPWNYPLPDPRQYELEDRQGRPQPGPAVQFFKARVCKLLDEFDGLRIDHPHGLICPWVYRADQKDPGRAVQTGARLFASPALTDHPELARFAIARPDQLNQTVPRYADDWVVDLEPDQVRRYGQLFGVIMETALAKGRDASMIVCEILSTQPYPIQRVMELYDLGRFRVTQKADLDQPLDVYRSENARPQDWLMLGNHDTPSIWKMAHTWLEEGTAPAQAAYLADRLNIPEAGRNQWIAKVSADPGALVQAKFADLFLGPARNIMVFFTDVFGMTQAYNQPGSVSDTNWSLRIEADYQDIYRARAAQHLALDIPGALALALRSKGDAWVARHRDLIAALEAQSPARSG